MRKPTRRQLAEQVRTAVLQAAAVHSTSARHPSLMGWCAIASTVLAEQFQEHGYRAQVRVGKVARTSGEHAWVESGGYVYDGEHAWVESGGYVYDVTATQFGHDFPPVVIARRGKTWRPTDTPLDIWPRGQQPLPSLTRTIKRRLPR